MLFGMRFLAFCIAIIVYSSTVQAQLLTGLSPEAPVARQASDAVMSYSLDDPFLTQPTDLGDEPPDQEDPVDLQADSLKHDQQSNIVTASGNVMMVQNDRILRADEVSYNLTEDSVMAKGNVVLNEPNGDIHFAQEVEFKDGFKDGLVKTLQTTLADESRFQAKTGERVNAQKIKMRGASYTPCETCEYNPDASPTWGIRASNVTYHEDENRISYTHPRFEVYGVPILYLPYFSHPDGSVEQKSGFLTPSLGFKSDLGTFIEQNYYVALSESMDTTLGVLAFSDDNPVGLAQFRKRWNKAEIELNGGITHSERTDRIGGEDVDVDSELRGHVLGRGVWNMNQKWRSGFRVNYASDDQYMRQYDFTNEDILENEIYAERFSGRNYAVGRIFSFQDTRIRDDDDDTFADIDQPQILPEIVASFVGEPDSMPAFGGRWGAEFSTLGLRRNGEEQDVNRLSADLSWEKRAVNLGVLTDFYASVRGDYFNVRDRSLIGANSNEDDTVNETRLFPQFHMQSAYPLVKGFTKAQWIVEPIAAVTFAPNLNLKADIPNEDSQDVQIDASNIFEPNRFPGLDEVEDQSRVTYGMRTGLYGHRGSFAKVFIGQSYRFDDDDNPFPQGSGLNERESDFVGELTANYLGRGFINYRTQLANDNLSSQRHEIDANLYGERWSVNSRYIFAKALGGTDIDESREQFRTDLSYDVTENWRARFGGIQDLGDDPGLRRAYFALDYTGQCLNWSLTAQRNLTDEATGESEAELFFRVGLKNLSGF